MSNHFVSLTHDGWLQVRNAAGSLLALPYGLKVKRLEVKAGREYFEILEGVNKGQKASVVAVTGGSYLTEHLRHRAGANVQFDRKSQSLQIDGLGPFNAFSGGGHGGYTAVAAGTYQLAIPAYPSKQTRPAYSTWTSRHAMWFRIGIDLSGSRFLHCGAISEGCVTVRQFIYNPETHVPPPAGFEDLAAGARSSPGLLGLPLPSKPAPTIGWDKLVDSLILCRLNDQAVGHLTVT